MKKFLSTLFFSAFIGAVFAQPADLNGVTFGFGMGYSYTFNKTYDYALTTDANHNLKLQPLNKGAFVISSVVMVKLGKIAFDQGSNQFVSQAKKTEYRIAQEELSNYRSALSTLNYYSKKDTTFNNLKKAVDDAAGVSFWDHLSVNLALDLVNVTPNVSFNKAIDGGLGLGYFITPNLQVAVFYDVSRISQLRNYIVSEYQDKPIPNGHDVSGASVNYNSLDVKDTNLFYTKTISGLSFKLIVSLANKKD